MAPNHRSSFLVVGVGEACFGEAGYGFVGVVDALDDPWTLEVLDGSAPKLLASAACEYHLGFSSFGHAVLTVLVDVAVGVSADVDGFLPRADGWGNVVDQYRRPENCAVEGCSDGAVGAAPFLFEVVFFYAVFVGGDGGAFDADAVLLDGFGCFEGNFVVGFVSVLELKVVVFEVHVEVGQKKLIFDHLPHDAGHFVSVYLDDWCFYANFITFFLPLASI